MTLPELGVIEGYYGRPWSWEKRAETVAFLAGHGYGFYFYAPKADPYLRRLWREPHPNQIARHLVGLSDHCRSHGMRFGIGLSPTRLHHDFDGPARAELGRKLAALGAFDLDDLALLFDDMKGDVPDLADRQAEIVAWTMQHAEAERIFVCPSYYSDDPVLDCAFGARPDGYLERLGELLHPDVEVFWTGEEVVARELSLGHLRRVGGQLRRKPFLWDNYPVNDGERMSQFLHVRGFTGRPAAIADHIAGHAINPALQPTLTRIPALTLVEAYANGDAYQYGAATRHAARTALGEQLGDALWRDLLELQEVGLDRLAEKAAELRARYAAFDHAGAREVVGWLDGEYRITDAIVRGQSGEE